MTRTMPTTLTPEEGRSLFDHVARTTIGLSGEEFIRRFDAGDYCDAACQHPAAYLLLLEPFWRRVAVDRPSPCRTARRAAE